MQPVPELCLKKGEDRRLRAGHLWVYSNEIDTRRTPLKGLEPGQLVSVVSDRGQPVGAGFANPASLICCRLLARKAGQVQAPDFLEQRLRAALALRERLYEAPFYRMVYGEADGLPGLVVDRFGEVLVVQCTTAGMETRRAQLTEVFTKVLNPAGILWRNDTGVRAMEGLDSYIEAEGEVPDSVQLVEHGVRFRVPLQDGQKTGWFFDHCENRRRLHRYVAGARVLDVFSYLGAWGLQAACHGASELVCVDSSAPALDHLAHNAALNGVADRVQARQGDAFEVLRELRDAGERFDVVVLDPPAFIKRRKDLKAGVAAYRRINELAMGLLGEAGFLVSASCSHHLDEPSLTRLVQESARHSGRLLRLLERGYQGPDHPVHPAMPETAYLKALFCHVHNG